MNWTVGVSLAALVTEKASHAFERTPVQLYRWGQLYKSASAVVERQDLYSSWRVLIGEDKLWYNTLALTGLRPSSSQSWLFNSQSVCL